MVPLRERCPTVGCVHALEAPDYGGPDRRGGDSATVWSRRGDRVRPTYRHDDERARDHHVPAADDDHGGAHHGADLDDHDPRADDDHPGSPDYNHVSPDDDHLDRAGEDHVELAGLGVGPSWPWPSPWPPSSWRC